MEHLINLNFAPGGLPATVHVSQYDDTIRQLRFQLWFGRSKVEVPSGASVRVDIKKPDGHIVLVSGTVDSSDRSIVTVPTTKQMTAVPGGARGTLVVSSTGDKRISSAIFILQVHRDPVEDGDASDSDLSMLQDAIDQTAANATAAQAAATAAQQAASSFTTDTTLSVSGKAADAKKTGDEISAIKADLGALTDLETENKNSIVSAINEVAGGGLSDEVKNALLACLRNVPYLSDNGVYEMLSDVLDGESECRFITTEDIESSVGYGNISVNNGTVTPETFVSFSILTYNTDFIRFTTPENLAHARFVFNKSGTSYYVVSAGGVIMRFDKSGTKYTAEKNIDQTFATITKYNGFSNVENGKRYQVGLDNGIFRLSSMSGEKLMEITNANIIGYWGDASENLGKLWRFENARILKEYDYRFITLNDIENSLGYGNITISEGTVIPATFESFSIVTYNTTYIRFSVPDNYMAHPPARFVFKKDGTSYYIVNDGGTIMRFDKSGSKYEAVKNIDQTFATITKYNGFSYLENGKRYQLELDSENHIFRLLSMSGVKLMEITNANIIGYWGDNSESLIRYWRFINTRTTNDD